MKNGLLILLLFAFTTAHAQQAAEKQACQILGSRVDQFEFETYSSLMNKILRGSAEYEDLAYLHSMPIPFFEHFTIFHHKDKIAVWGSNDSCILAGLNYYLKCYQQHADDDAYWQKEERVLRDYIARYPEAQLRDVYKFLFQDVYGPGHLIDNIDACRQRIVSEMEWVSLSDSLFPDYEYTGIDSNFVRVSLRVVKEGRVPLNLYADLLMRSTEINSPMPVYDWKCQWMHYLPLMLGYPFRPTPHNFDDDVAEIKALLDSGRYVAHHSARFNEAYHPHYRLIRRDLFETYIKPML